MVYPLCPAWSLPHQPSVDVLYVIHGGDAGCDGDSGGGEGGEGGKGVGGSSGGGGEDGGG